MKGKEERKSYLNKASPSDTDFQARFLKQLSIFNFLKMLSIYFLHRGIRGQRIVNFRNSIFSFKVSTVPKPSKMEHA